MTASFVHPLHDPSSDAYVPPNMWCITKEQLGVFEAEVCDLWEHDGIPQSDIPKFFQEGHDDRAFGPSIHQVNEHYIKPITRDAGGMSWALMQNREGLACTLFATHCWSEGIFEVIRWIRKAWPSSDVTGGREHLWVCFIANPQNSDISIIVGTANNAPLKVSPFAVALASARTMLVIPNSHTSIYTRLWCVFEAYFALQYVETGRLALELPSGLDKSTTNLAIVRSVFFAVIGLCGVLFLDQYVPVQWFGPVMWMLIGVILGEILFNLGSRLGHKFLAHEKALALDLSLLVLTFLIFGACAGMSFRSFQLGMRSGGTSLYSHHHRIALLYRFAPGEEHAFAVLLVALYILYSELILFHLLRLMHHEEAQQLEFETVRDAICTDKADEERIRKEIQGREDDVDEFINKFKRVGRFNQAVDKKLKLGLTPKHVARGTVRHLCLKSAAACTAWNFWWMAELVGRGDVAAAYAMMMVTMILAIAVTCLAGEYVQIAVDIGFFFGIAYVLVSNHPFFFNDETVAQNRLSITCRRLKFICAAIAISTGVFAYGGGWKRVQDACTRIFIVSHEEEVEDEDGNDEVDDGDDDDTHGPQSESCPLTSNN